MILNLKDRMTTVSIVHHPTSRPNVRQESIIAKADRLKPVVLTFQETNKITLVEDAVETGMAEKSKEFNTNGKQLYSKV